MSWSTLLFEVRDGVGLLTLNRPAARNAIDETMRAELADAVRMLRGDDGLKAVILTGAGGAFCAGGDVRAMASRRRTAYESRQRIHALHAWLPELVNLEKPVIAAVDGPAYGGGFSLALAADFVLATPRAQFCLVFARIGLVPDMAAMYLLPRIVGLSRAKELVYSARSIDSSEARTLGIVHAIHEPERLLGAALELAASFRHASSTALGLAKSILNQSFQLDQRAAAELESYAQGICMDTDYHREAIARFLAKRSTHPGGEPA